jgi:thioesterase domain-containing protein
VQARNWINVVPIKTRGTRVPFFCVHGAGGNVLAFKHIAEYLSDDQPFYGIQAVGVDGRQRPLTSIKAMAALHTREIRAIQPDGPYFLGGFSMGGEVAFEIAQQLTQQGEEVALVVLLDTYNPDRAIRRPNPMSAKVEGHAQRLKQMGLKEKATYVAQWLRMKGERVFFKVLFRLVWATGRPVPYKYVERLLWESNLAAVESYVPDVYPGRLTLFRASQSLDTNQVNDPMGWGPLAAGGVEEYVVEGTHNIVNEPYVREVTAILQDCIDRAARSRRVEPER